jgi:hypothetical protein
LSQHRAETIQKENAGVVYLEKYPLVLHSLLLLRLHRLRRAPGPARIIFPSFA